MSQENPSSQLDVEFIYLPVINYSMQQNRIPVVRLLSIKNNTEHPLADLKVFLTLEPEFASRYVNESFSVYDEYVQASLDDFLNLNNGLFLVNCSNDQALELTLTAPEHFDGQTRSFNKACKLKLLYPFGAIHFIIEF